MQRVVVLMVTLGIAGWVPALSAQSSSLLAEGEPWFASSDVMWRTAPEKAATETNSAAETNSTAGTTGSGWWIDGDSNRSELGLEEVDLGYRTIVRFGSGLEDDAPVRTPSVFMLSGLEHGAPDRARAARASLVRFGSGLEDDAPARVRNSWLVSGLEPKSVARKMAISTADRYGSGLEEDAQFRSPSVFHQAGF